MRSRFLVFVAAWIILSVAGCRSDAQMVEKEAYGIMDTDVIIKAYGKNASSAIDKALDEMRRLDKMFSAYDAASEVSLINRRAGIDYVAVSPEVLALVERSLFYARLSDGVYDPTILPIMRVWGFGETEQHIPAPAAIDEALQLVDWKKVRLDKASSRVLLEDPGMAIDLGSIAKGFAVDRMADVMRSEGIGSFLINAGGNVYAQGSKPDKTGWSVAVTDPRDPGDFLGIIGRVDGVSIVSSGDYQRYFEEEGKRYHHIMDAKTGYPAPKVRGTTVFLPSSEDADGLSTALFILGPERAEKVMDEFPDIGVIFVLPDGDIAVKGIVDGFEFK